MLLCNNLELFEYLPMSNILELYMYVLELYNESMEFNW